MILLIGQLANLREVSSVSNIMCKTMNIDSVQRNPFLMPSKDNKMVNCNQTKELDYFYGERKHQAHIIDILIFVSDLEI